MERPSGGQVFPYNSIVRLSPIRFVCVHFRILPRKDIYSVQYIGKMITKVVLEDLRPTSHFYRILSSICKLFILWWKKYMYMPRPIMVYSILFDHIYIKVSPPSPSQISGVIKIMSSINPLCVSLCACVLYVCWRNRGVTWFGALFVKKKLSSVHSVQFPPPPTLQPTLDKYFKKGCESGFIIYGSCSGSSISKMFWFRIRLRIFRFKMRHFANKY